MDNVHLFSTLYMISDYVLHSTKFIPQMKMEVESALVKTEFEPEEKEDNEAELQRRRDQRERSVKFTPR